MEIVHDPDPDAHHYRIVSVVATGHALHDALDRAIDLNFNGIWNDRHKQEPDYYEMARALRDLGFLLVKKEPHG